MSDNEILSIYDEGHDVSERGGYASECKYPEGSYERERWMLGFEDGGGDA